MKTPLISNEVVFILSFTGAAPTEVSNIYFQYGTSLGETQVPEPGYMLLLGMGLFSASLIGWRFKKF